MSIKRNEEHLFERIKGRIEIVSVKTRGAVIARCPWARKIVKLEGVFLAFESYRDYVFWRHQGKYTKKWVSDDQV